MKRSIAKKWIVALKSGNYKQGLGQLKEEDTYCVLGVLCDLYIKDTGRGKWGANGFYGQGSSSGSSLVSEVRNWAGMTTSNGKYNGESLMSRNDEGSSFIDLAKVIKNNVENL